MATITTDFFLDDGVARTAGETWAMNGGRLTVRTDTRWHANAPANRLGSLGAVTISPTLGGGYTIDGRNVRWLPYNTGSGNVPAIGSTITQGGITGYLLGVWVDLASAPSAVGSAMPASGFIKFREVSGGTFSSGALTGIGASATGPDVTGWIEVVHDQAIAINVPRLGSFVVRGDWFYLDNTTGSAGQIIQTPTNGGGAGTECPGIWIEDSPGSNTYDFFPSLETTCGFTTTNLGTDQRSKFVHNILNGQIRIGSDGTNDIGFVPPAGCKVRIPNVIGRQTTSANRALNLTPHATVASRPDFTTTSAGYIDVEYFMSDWYFLFAQPYYVKLNHFCTFDTVNISECATALDLRDGFTGMTGGTAGLDINSMLLTSNFAGGVIEDWGGPRGNAAGSNDHDISIAYCIGQTFTRVRAGILTYARSSGVPIYINQCSDLTFNNCRTSNGPITINTSFNIKIYNKDHVDRYVGATTTATGYAFVITNSCVGVYIDGLTFGLGGLIPNCHPYTGLVSCAASSDIKIRNFGTRSSFLSGGSANFCAYAFVDGGNNQNVKIQRVYIQPTRTGIHSSQNSTKNVLYEDCYGDWTDAITVAALNCLVRGGGGTNSVTGQASVYGTHFGGAFTSDTTGRMWLALNEPTTETLQYCEMNFSSGSGFTSAGGLSLATQGDYFICEMQEHRLQTTGFANIAPVITGTNAGNHSFEYQIDNGSGWNGTWKTLNGANLSAETIQPNIGYKLKLKITCTVANNANLISYVRYDTTSTLEAQVNNLYPLDTNTVTFTGLPSGYDAVVLSAGTTTILDQKDSVNSNSYSYEYSGAQNVDVGFIKTGYIPFYIRNLSLTTNNSSIPVSLTPDRNFI